MLQGWLSSAMQRLATIMQQQPSQSALFPNLPPLLDSLGSVLPLSLLWAESAAPASITVTAAREGSIAQGTSTQGAAGDVAAAVDAIDWASCTLQPADEPGASLPPAAS